jgi:hypothetical protein
MVFIFGADAGSNEENNLLVFDLFQQVLWRRERFLVSTPDAARGCF